MNTSHFPSGPRARRLLATGALLAPWLLLGCTAPAFSPSGHSDPEIRRAALAVVPDVLGFEAADGWSAAGGQLTLVASPRVEGQRAGQLAGFTDATLTSTILSTDAPLPAEVTVDLQLAGPAPPSGWTASLLVSVLAPSRGVEQPTLVGSRSVATLARGRFHRLQFAVPQPLREMLTEGATDLSVIIGVRSSRNDQVFVLDRVAALGARPVAPLPFWMSYCSEPTCGGRAPVVVHVCPASNPGCTPTRSTTVIPQVDGRQINQILLPINTPPGHILRVVSGDGESPGGYVIARSGQVVLRSDVSLTLSYYEVAPVFGATTPLDFVSLRIPGSGAVTTTYRHPSFLTGDEILELDRRSREIIAEESGIAGIFPGRMNAFFLPTELATVGEGNFSDGSLNITMNYSNPPFIATKGGIQEVVMPRFAHEYVHELFSEIQGSYPGGSACLNEGIADAFPFAAGFLPEGDFGPRGLRGTDFDQGCAEVMDNFELHDAGNCPLWQVRRLGLLSRAFASAMLHPQHTINFDSCDLRSERTGNAYLVLFTEAAAGQDLTEALRRAEIPNAGSYEAARRALGL